MGAVPQRTVILTGLGFGAGILLGLAFQLLGWGQDSLAVSYLLAPLITVYLNALKFIAIPVTFFSILVAVAAMADLKTLGRIGGLVLLLFSFTGFSAIGIGYGLFQLFRPADGFSLIQAEAYGNGDFAAPTLLETVTGLVPDNILAPFIQGNMLQIIFIALLLGLGLNLLGEKAGLLRRLANECYSLFLRLTALFISLAPLATFAAMARLVAVTGMATLLPLAKLLATVSCGMLCMLLLYSLMLLTARLNPLVFYRKWGANLLLAFSLNSACATVPVTLDTCQRKLGISPKVCAFVIPLGATVDKCGSAVYLIISTLFLAQVYGLALSPAQLLAVALSIFVLASGSGGISGSGLVCLSILAGQLQIPMEGVGMLIGLDKLFGMMRSSINVSSDAVCSCLAGAWSGLLDRQAFNHLPAKERP